MSLEGKVLERDKRERERVQHAESPGRGSTRQLIGRLVLCGLVRSEGAMKDNNVGTRSGIMCFEPPEIAPILVFSAGSYSKSSG